MMLVANEIIDALRPFCSRIEIAGSLRRQKTLCSDVEVLYVPRIERQLDSSELFGDGRIVDVARAKINDLVALGVLDHRVNVNGSETWGDKNKLAVHVPTGFPVDLFATTEENWWVSLVVRTGSLETNLRLTNGALARGRSLNAYGCGVTDKDTGNVIRAESERQVFELCGITYLEPTKR